MVDLVPPDPEVAASAAPVKMVPEEILEKPSSRLNAAARAAYDAIFQFRNVVIHGRIKRCISWLISNMSDFVTHTVDVFGSMCYHLELCTGDIDVVVILGPGQNNKTWLEQLRHRSEASGAFTGKRKWQRHDCLQTEFEGCLWTSSRSSTIAQAMEHADHRTL